MRSLMKLTSLLLVETLSPTDYIMVNVSNTKCTDNIVLANSSQQQLIEVCIANEHDVNSVDINTTCQRINRYSSINVYTSTS